MDLGSFNFGDLLAKAQTLTSQMSSMKESMTNTTFSGADEDGAVTISMNGKFEPVSVRCDAELFGDEEATILENLIMAALIQVTKQVREAEVQNRQNLGASLGLPPGMMNQFPGF